MKRVIASSVALLLAVAASSLFLSASAVVVPSGTWAPTGDLAEPRAGAAAVLLTDGIVLITGGAGAEGSTASAERYNAANGTFGAAASMRTARASHTATSLNDGRVLVIGGRSAGAAVVGGAEIYDPATNTWTPAGTLVHARAGHTATLLPDGRVLVAGGENAEGALATLEVYSPVFEEFSLVAAPLTAARMRHAAALAGEKVLIVGGWDGSAALASVDIYDPSTDSVAAGPAMLGARAEHTATTLLSGNVLVAGGMNAQGELQTAEIFDAAAGAFVATNGMRGARRNHIALLLPHNNSVLIAGGWSGGAASAAAELYREWQDGGVFISTGSSTSGRNWSAGSALSFAASATNRSGPADGLVVVAGGDGSSGAELYGFATVKTDKDDYSPGMTVRVSGSGWQPNQSVTFYLRELPAEHYARLFTLDADNSGNIEWTDLFLVEEHHLGVHFLLTAGDGVSQAQTAFTDSNPQSVVVAAPTSVTVTPGGTAIFGNVTVVEGGNTDSCTITLSTITGTGTGLPAGAAPVFGTNPLIMTTVDVVSTFSVTTTSSTPTGTFTFQVAESIGGGGCQGPAQRVSDVVTLIVAPATVDTTTTASHATATYGDTSVTLNATVSPAGGVGTVFFTIKDGGTTVGSVTSGPVTAGSASANFSLSVVNADTYTIEAAYSGGTGFNPSNNATQDPVPTLTVNKAASATTVSCSAGPFTYNGAAHTPCTASVTGAGGLNQSLAVSYTNNVNAGTASASATFAETANHLGSSGSENFTIGKADATIVVNGYTGTYDAAPHGATGSVTGVDAGGAALGSTLDLGASFINFPGGTATWTFTGGTNYTDETGTVPIVINKAVATVTVNGYTGTYDGAAHGATGSVTGVDAGGAALGTTLNFGATFTNVPGGTATWTFSGGTNYTDQTGTAAIVINKATPIVTVSFEPSPITYDGDPHPATVVVTGVSGPLAIPANGTTAITYTRNASPFAGTPTPVGVYTAAATFTSTNGNYANAASTVNASLTILTACGTFNGFLSPIGGAVEHGTGGSVVDPVRSFKLNSTIPLKFSATCFDAPLVTGIQTLKATRYSNAGTPDSPIDATPTDAATTGNQFRLSGVEWHFNLSTKALGATAQGIWLLEATLFDGSTYTVWVEIKK